MTDYKNFYGFSENPFGIAQNPKYFFPSESHREALASLQYGITNRKGFILILGETGIGKTLLIQHLISTLDKQVKIIYFPQCQIPFPQMLKEMLVTLKIPSGVETKGSMIHKLYNHLIECLKQDENVVVIIDKAESIDLDQIEELRLLANLETSTSKLLQIILVGQPELGKKLGANIVRQIKQRIVISYKITPLTEEESLRYIDHRLKIADSNRSKVFTDEALSLICKSAKGIPLALNILCSNALSIGCRLSEKNISASTIRKIRHEKGILTTQKVRMRTSGIKRHLPRKIFLIPLALVFLATALFFNWNDIKPYVQPVFNALRPNYAVAPPTLREKDATPKAKRRLAEKNVKSGSVPKVTENAPESPEIPVSSPVAAGDTRQEIRIMKIVEVKQGINLSLLAYQHYKTTHETLVDHILKLNPEITNPNLIQIGQKISIPEITESLLIVQNSEGLYKVHLRTFADFKRASQYKQIASSWAKEIEIVPWRISAEQTWYRIMAGPFVDRDEALSAIEKMKQMGFSIIPSWTG